MVIEKKKPMEKVKGVLMKIGKRNMIIIAAVLLVGVAVLVNWAVFSDDGGGGYGGYDQSSGMNNSYIGTSGNTADGEDYIPDWSDEDSFDIDLSENLAPAVEEEEENL